MRLPQENPRRLAFKTKFARELRRDMTKHERIIWFELRARRFDGLHFRRQQTIGPYIADFYCASAKLIIELDGGHHTEIQQLEYDTARTRWLEANGFRVLRFSNFAGKRELNSILEAIWQATHLPPSP
ncbi:MAG TPA: DUF559 domain-containing protein [Micropepsaceae bacterium]|nr:DUF559 domain-containing protein [Micropepsaceae bacterium]